MSNKIEIQDLTYNNKDKVLSVVKGAFGAIPIAGPLAQELLGAIIPNQRLDRVVIFIEKIDETLQNIGAELADLQEKALKPEYASLFYKSCMHSADTVTEERIEYIRNIFVKGLCSVDKDLIRHESLLSLLSRMNDIELIYLKLYYLLKWDIDKFKVYHEEAGIYSLLPITHGGMSREEMDKENAKEIYHNNLISLGLLEMEYNSTGKGKYKCSKVGDMLMRTILE